MKFFRDQPFKVQATYLLALFFLLFISQFFFLRWKSSSLNELSVKSGFTRSAQLKFQQIVLFANQYVNENNQTTNIHEYIDNQDYQLKLLSEGGHIEGSGYTIGPLSGQPKKTYDELNLRWNAYKENLQNLLTGSQSQSNTNRIKKRLGAQWLAVSGWYEKLVGDLEYELSDKRSDFNVWLFVFIFFDALAVLLIYFIFNRKLLYSLKTIEVNTARHTHTTGLPENEIKEVATQVNAVIEQLKDATDFVQRIGGGDLSIDYRELDATYTPGKNRLADSLIDMQSKLKVMNEEEQKRKWANEGLTRFVDILRASGDNISALGDKIVSALVQYTRSNQGGLYVLNDDDANNKFLELISLFAFDTKKHEKQRVRPGEGILGQTFLERETICLNEVPEDYVRIRSGLGNSNPKALLVVPLKIDQQVYGVVELASFNQYESHEITFVEKLGETIASTLATVKAAQRNRKLLENSELAAEQMRAQEEEMRQNMEELQATQEEMARKERDYLSKIHDLEEKLKHSASGQELEEAKKSITELQREYETQIRRLKDELMEKVTQGDDWEVAREVEKALKMNLEALKITREESDRPS